jgi:hypothetical protein
LSGLLFFSRVAGIVDSFAILVHERGGDPPSRCMRDLRHKPVTAAIMRSI